MVKKKRKNSTVSPFCYSVEVHYSDTSDYEQLLSLQIEGKFIVFTGLPRTLFPFFSEKEDERNRNSSVSSKKAPQSSLRLALEVDDKTLHSFGRYF